MTNTLAAVLPGDGAGLPEPVSDAGLPAGAPVNASGGGPGPSTLTVSPPTSPSESRRGGPDCISFVVPGEPTPWARAGGGRSVVRFTPAKQRNYMGAVKLFCANAMRGAAPFDGPLSIRVSAVYAWPASMSAKKRSAPGAAWKISRPDIDNCCLKLVADSLNTVAFTDDARICSAHLYKYYGDFPALHVEIRKLV